MAWDEATMVIARLSQGIGSAIASPTGLALVATTFPKGPARNAATATAVRRILEVGPAAAMNEFNRREQDGDQGSGIRD